MKFTILTLFPEIVEAYFGASIMAKAVDRGIISYEVVNIRDFAFDRHRTCDDAPYGGGAGMVMKAEPIATAIETVLADQPVTEGQKRRILYPSPTAPLYHQDDAERLSRFDHLIILCGRYEGIDERVIEEYVDERRSLGDYVLSSGEVAALTIVDTVYRLIDGVITGDSLEEESFQEGLLEYPQYTRPEVFHGKQVPEILRSGNHAAIEEWRYRQRLELTRRFRPDLLVSKEGQVEDDKSEKNDGE
ncbi:MAG: tRNA (guanosine(37)-N1)-methyltransferase TrmD [Spirochaetales bacterium]|nr:tRNA (guanosine(37)-N1)-methyltransferase TrmD [Spirochaetales bacterium]MCF7937438.1 tRNA (guanosine(37)-N1)-methyltransferase TrmD [Spirochaetales bacterium]